MLIELSQITFCNKCAKFNINTEIEMTCKNVIEDAVHEDYESDLFV